MPLPSLLDEELLALSRSHLNAFLRGWLEPLPLGMILEIGPKLGWPSFDTLDINPAVPATYHADITKRTPIADSSYDMVLCISVLEHTLDPFQALAEIRRILKPGGLLLAQAPLNFRQHGPAPDLWRFGLHGWQLLLKDWSDVILDPLETPERPLMPVAYTASARCNKDACVPAESLKWGWIS